MRRLEASFTLRAKMDTDFSLLVTPALPYRAELKLQVRHDGELTTMQTGETRHGAQEITLTTPEGEMSVALTAEVAGHIAPIEAESTERYLRSSRYVDVDAVRDFASERFGGGREGVSTQRTQIESIVRWIARGFSYRPELSALDDSATDTLRKSGGMCRDYTHVVIALARALGIPARYVSVFAPGLVPQDFHAVAEVFVDDAWWVIDSTRLAPRKPMVRIATGLDAQETAWVTNSGSGVEFVSLSVQASADEPHEIEPVTEWIQLT
ncbi:transglutaminase-like domain-containing protein [Agrococcus casei]|nr:transglutaminase family protein [Agrococcus casei]